MDIQYYICEKNIDKNELEEFFFRINSEFTPYLEKNLNICEYAEKLSKNAIIFITKVNNIIVGMAAIYYNTVPDYSFGTFMGVLKEYRKYGIALQLEENYIEYFKKLNTPGIKSVVNCNNKNALKLHKYFGFEILNKFYDEIMNIEKYELILKFNKK